MIAASSLTDRLDERGFTFYTGVPCSFLTPLMNEVISSETCDYVGATHEAEALAMVAGAWLAGKKGVTLCQNSGLGNIVNPLVSLHIPFSIPQLIITTWRGQDGVKDEPQHRHMGSIMASFMDSLGLGWKLLPADETQLDAALNEAEDFMERHHRPFALVVAKGTIKQTQLIEPSFAASPRGIMDDRRRHPSHPPKRIEWLGSLTKTNKDMPLIATTGKCGRELHHLGDAARNFYHVGAMGCASSVALGLAFFMKKSLCVIDGDGAALMQWGSWATIGTHHPPNLLHILLDNGSHDSTGGQKTVSRAIDFPAVALACGYRHVVACDDIAGFEEILHEIFSGKIKGLTLIHCTMAEGSISPLGRPIVPPDEMAQRFQSYITHYEGDNL